MTDVTVGWIGAGRMGAALCHRLLDHGVELAQGHLFGRPKPMSPALFREIDDAA